MMVVSEESFPPDAFTDPEHVLESLGDKIEEAYLKQRDAKDQKSDTVIRLFLNLGSDPFWKPALSRVASRNPTFKFYADAFLSRIPRGPVEPPAHAPAVPRPTSSKKSLTCTSFTGTLRKCACCGKMEGGKNEFNQCSRCHSVVYCGRDCQSDHWHNGGHKQDCLRLRQSAS